MATSSALLVTAHHAPTHDRTLAIATIALLLSGVFDVGRAIYCRFRLSYAVTQSASMLSKRAPSAKASAPVDLSEEAAELVRRISGIRDLPRSAVLARSDTRGSNAGGSTAPSSSNVTVSVRYTLPLLSPYVRALFRDGDMSIEAIGAPTRDQRSRATQETTKVTTRANPATQSICRPSLARPAAA